MLMVERGAHVGVFSHKATSTASSMSWRSHAVIETDPATMPPIMRVSRGHNTPRRRSRQDPEDIVEPPLLQEDNAVPDSARRALEAKSVTIDVMMLYTKRAASRYMIGPVDLIELAIEQATRPSATVASAMSSCGWFTHSASTTTKQRRTVSAPVPHGGRSGAVQGHSPLARREEGRRRWIDSRGSDGLRVSTRVGADAEEAYFVVHHSCATLTISIAHEIGHILGARHDRVTDDNNTPTPYATVT